MDWASASPLRNRRVLVTGASGFLGHSVCRVLVCAGAEVHGIIRSRSGPNDVPCIRATLPEGIDAVMDAVIPEVVIHLAAPVRLECDVALFGTLRPGIVDASDAVARSCLHRDIRLVHVGTCAEYGNGTAPFSEDSPPRPVSPYAVLKAAATHWVLALTRTTSLQATVVRPFRTYGPHDTQSVVAQACHAALTGTELKLTDGSQIREWNHVDTIARGIVAAASHPDALGALINLGGGERRSVAEMVHRVFQLAGGDPSRIQIGALPRRPGEVDRFWGDHARAQALWGHISGPSLDTGLAETIAWHRTRLDLANAEPA